MSDLNPKSSKIMKKHTQEKNVWKKIQNSLFVFGLLNLLWLLFRTGTKPSRVVYPCQKAAIKNVSFSLSSILGFLSLGTFYTHLRSFFGDYRILSSLFFLGTIITSTSLIYSTSVPQELLLDIEETQLNTKTSSEIFVVNGRDIAHISNLIDLMGENGLLFYQSSILGANTGPDGLIGSKDVVLIKNNCQWPKRGGTNTDMIMELIEAIYDHPAGFTGEVVIADNGQGRGSMNWKNTNSEDKQLSAKEVANSFDETHKVSVYLWDSIKNQEVEEFSEGDMNDGYIVYDTPDPESGFYVTYPKFTTEYGSKISFKHGIWNGTGYEDNLKIINFPILKTHSGFGVTATLKHYMGVQSQGLGNGHDTIATGSMGTLIAELGLPTLNIIDAIWINAIPRNGPGTYYSEATRVNILISGLDPVALDYWVAKNILMQASAELGYENLHTLNPDSSDSTGITEAFGVWLNRSKEELITAGINVTSNEEEISVFTNSLNLTLEPIEKSYWWIYVSSAGGLITLVGIFLLILRKKELIFN